MKSKTQITIGDLAVDIYGSQGKPVWIFFAGFPGPLISQQPPGRRPTIDTVAEILVECGFCVAYPYYSGVLKSKNQFSFFQTVEDGKKVFQHFDSLGQSVNLIGHSWGALVATNLFELLKRKSKVLLITPYLFLPEKGQFEKIVSSFFEKYPEDFSSVDRKHILSGYEKLLSDHNPKDHICNGKDLNVRAIIGKQDEVVAYEQIGNFLTARSIGYSVMDQGHVFDTNEKFIELVRENVV